MCTARLPTVRVSVATTRYQYWVVGEGGGLEYRSYVLGK